ncbi:MAG TPA: hypothetical protein VN843_36085 [Anaerolineales bacterium]|nr:hypothetical protein [Anaerolineales bacterium]
MRISISGALLKALLDFVHDLVVDSDLSESNKRKTKNIIGMIDEKSSQIQNSSLYRSYFHKGRMETRVEIDEDKLTAILLAFNQYRLVFVVFLNLLIYVIKSVETIKKMLSNIPGMTKQEGDSLTDEIERIIRRPTSWSKNVGLSIKRNAHSACNDDHVGVETLF